MGAPNANVPVSPHTSLPDDHVEYALRIHQVADHLPPLTFEAAVSTYRDALERFITGIVSAHGTSYDLVQDLVQETVCRVWLHQRTRFALLQSEQQQRAYLYTTAARIAVNYLRQRKGARGRVQPWSSYVRQWISTDADASAIADACLTDAITQYGTGRWYAGAIRLGDDPAEILMVRERIHDVIASLTAEQRAIVVLLGEGFALPEVARLLDISYPVAKQRAWRARHVLCQRTKG